MGKKIKIKCEKKDKLGNYKKRKEIEIKKQ